MRPAVTGLTHENHQVPSSLFELWAEQVDHYIGPDPVPKTNREIAIAGRTAT
jgi:hypothetical protein